MSVKETNLRRRILKPTRLTTPDVENFMKSHAIVHGKTVGKDGQAYDQVVARGLIYPCTGTKNIHYYTDSIETARRIAMKIPNGTTRSSSSPTDTSVSKNGLDAHHQITSDLSGQRKSKRSQTTLQMST